ncbi:hypothetical protein B9Q13_00120 [Candidatus Marsarchaeota G2 archaeon ECH_B_SAG-G16]|jgi:methionyl-tRNA synthetase/methionyl-tRNA synthetase C-terminal region/beta chain|uniref:Methionine--tRNA ligase n=5 Tax=Candidatus Marsarchaeota TaxID=1978152 RepID=A0A2R6BZ10_9ARCH|nr:MAG: hypothetical protein B9Q01_05745 [Candidatus Marsarchaeota G1 archaeon OSP_D]PSN86798.1 MAG: hypothetical protein B9Q02_01155 [Candidatus Marsarchaeota G1 archaeon BE_D]PSN88027.1 MAG: hypothetical protein B9Q00_06960 [Candidatus Marsarchaeota G1 archaeon OSP_C]PSO03880.1 MAG: hypothetical protein B9Q12_03510 [Candidatus Marsarchaeota G2 archaeon ECH_B_SAG-G06]PSO05957.1 MAG: hypothetical protein B9Q13_00120 [Candidatus Marsarchaeota G2 archaeon ECH_B_SAG-G16]
MKILVTAALPYANNELHIGHFRSTYIIADVYARLHRALGDDVVFICGTDEHGTPISLRAIKEGVSPIEITTKYYELDKKVFKDTEISFDYFGRTTSKEHEELVQWFFLELLKKGFITTKKTQQPYCEYDKRFLPDRYVRGTCKYCGYPDAKGDECDNCGRVLAQGDLLNPVCAICGKPTTIRETENWYFDLEKFHKELQAWIENSENLFPLYGKKYLLTQFLSKPLESFGITRDLEWGVPVPLQEAKGKVFYVWFDAPIGYVSFLKEYCDKNGCSWKDFWQNKDSKIVHFIGRNIIYHHGLFWPSMLLGVGLNLPTNIVAAGLLNLSGKKMAKSSGWMIKAQDFVKVLNNDYLRYYLIIAAPLEEDLDFKLEDFQKRVNGDLVDSLGNFVHRTLHFIYTKFNGEIPTPSNLSDDDKALINQIEQVKEKVISSIDSFEYRAGLDALISLARNGNKYLTKNAPWELVQKDLERAKTVLFVCAQLVKALALLSTPYLPGFSRSVWQLLTGQTSLPQRPFEELKTTLEGTKILEPKPVFQKIDDKTIKTLLPVETQKTQVTLQDFQKLDIRVAQVLEASKIPNSKKLLKLTVKIGNEIKTIVSGIADQYEPQSLIGKKIVVLNNLQPAEFMGVKSEAMLLAAEDNGSVSLLTVMRDIADGSPVH